jgi:peptidylprolyl isomerase
MSKRSKKQQESATPEKNTTPGKNTLTLAALILVIAVIAIAALVFLVPGSPLAGTVATSGAGTGAAVVAGNQVSVYYTGTFVNGTMFDSNVNKTPLTFTVGSGAVVKGFNDALIGMKAGQTKTVTVPVDQAYGPYKPEYIQVIDRTGDLATMNLVEGMILSATNPSTGAVSLVRVLKVTRDKVTVDGNSPLAGEPLVFTITLQSVN